MISLILIPFLCIVYFYKIDSFIEYRCIDLTLPDDGDFLEYKVPSLRIYKEFDFNGSKLDEKRSLIKLQFFLRKLVKKSDTINGAKVHLGSKTHYDVFIKVIDIIETEKVPTWGLFKNDFYILGSNNKPKRDKSIITGTRMNCGTSEWMRKENLRIQENRRVEEELQFRISFFKKQWIIFLGFFGIVFLNIFALVKFNKNE